MNKKIILSGSFEVPEADLEKVRIALSEHVELTKAEPGCLMFKVTEQLGRNGRFDVYEEFESKAAFEHHQNRVRESHWGKLTKHATREYSVEGLDDTSPKSDE